MFLRENQKNNLNIFSQKLLPHSMNSLRELLNTKVTKPIIE